MTLPYVLRLICLCLQSLFLVNAAMALVCFGVYRVVRRSALSMRPASAARLLLSLRLVPFATALLIVAGLCVPSYLHYEQNLGTEATGWFCLLAAALGLGLCVTLFARTVRALVQLYAITRQVNGLPQRRSKMASTPICITAASSAGAPLLSLVGILKPRLVVSPRLLQSLSPEQFDAALAHEDAHLRSHDNFKRLLLAITPGALPFVPGSLSMERQWQNYAELAADETASRGLPQRSIALAEALVQVARLANVERAIPLTSSLAAGNVELALRIDRLIAAGTDPVPAMIPARAWNGITFCLACTVVLALLPVIFHPLYRLLESLLH